MHLFFIADRHTWSLNVSLIQMLSIYLTGCSSSWRSSFPSYWYWDTRGRASNDAYKDTITPGSCGQVHLSLFYVVHIIWDFLCVLKLACVLVEILCSNSIAGARWSRESIEQRFRGILGQVVVLCQINDKGTSSWPLGRVLIYISLSWLRKLPLSVRSRPISAATIDFILMFGTPK